MSTPDVVALGERLDRVDRQNRLWKAVAFVALSVLGAVLVLGQADSEQQEKNSDGSAVAASRRQFSEYKVVRFPARRPFVKDPVPILEHELNAATRDGWAYVGLLALEANTGGYSGLVAFGRVPEDEGPAE